MINYTILTIALSCIFHSFCVNVVFTLTVRMNSMRANLKMINIYNSNAKNRVQPVRINRH